MDWSVLWQAGAFLVASGAVYGGIRSDLKSIHETQARHGRAIKKLSKKINAGVINAA